MTDSADKVISSVTDTYNAQGELESSVDQAGNTTSYTYDRSATGAAHPDLPGCAGRRLADT